MKGEAQSYWGTLQQPYWHPGANPTADLVLFKAVRGELEVLLIRRTLTAMAEPGKEAFPGGFQETDAQKGEPWRPGKETVEDTARREAEEEAGIVLPEDTPLVRVGIYEKGGRDPRDNPEAWTRNHVFAAMLPERVSAELNAGDDASRAAWYPLKVALGMPLAFDHSRVLLDACAALKIDMEPVYMAMAALNGVKV